MTGGAADADALMSAEAWGAAEPIAPVKRLAAPAKKPPKERTAATELPIARICVDVGLAHLDRPFDYLVPAALDGVVRPGVRVRVRFAGQLLDGFVLERVDGSEHAGKLAFVEKVVSPVSVLAPDIAKLARAVADRYAGTLADVIRLAVPPRHARAEASVLGKSAGGRSGAEASALGESAEETGDAEASALGESAEVAAGAGASALGESAERTGDAETFALAESAEVATGVGASALGESAERTGDAETSALGESAEGTGDAEATVEASPLGTSARGGGDAEISMQRRSAEGGEGAESGPAAAISKPGKSAANGRDARATSDVRVGGWGAYPSGLAFLQALGGGRAARAVWTALPGEDWPARIAEAVVATVHSGRGALVVVADSRDLDRVDAALTSEMGARERHVALSAAIGPQERYTRFLRARIGDVSVVLGNRAASFAPVKDLGLVVIWDDGDDAHAEPRSPYPHAREVLLTRAQLQETAVLLGGFARTVEAAQLIDNGWAKEIIADRDAIRRAAPLVSAVGDDIRDPEAAAARMPGVAWRAARDALAADQPVLVQVPRRGYLPSVACASCRAPARCPHCQGPLSLRSAEAQATCRWCARAAAGWACATCGGRSLRASIVGARRTAEELGRVFADVPIRTSGRDGVLATVEPRAQLVVSTPGAEPVVDGGGYGAVLLLDTWALLARADLRAGEETLRRWLAAAALALPASRGGKVVVVADGGLAAVQALVRFDPGWLAARDLAERRELGFPPTVRMGSLTGTPAALADLLAVARLPESAEVLGPVPVAEDQERYLVRVPRASGRALSDALRAASGVRSARKSPEPVRIQIDPQELL